jgi:hypothetical protein
LLSGVASSVKLRFRALVTALLALALALLLFPMVEDAEARGKFFVPVGADKSGFGRFSEPRTATAAARMKRVLGSPSSVSPEIYGERSCRLRWRGLGVVADFASYGTSPPDACRFGTFLGATLTDSRWRTARGIHPGSSRAAARRVSKRKCRRRTVGCGFVFGFALGLQPSHCAPGSFPTVIAEVAGGRVTALVVRSRSCE